MCNLIVLNTSNVFVCVFVLLSKMILLILLIWFHHMDTIVVLLLFLNLTLYLKFTLLNEDYFP